VFGEVRCSERHRHWLHIGDRIDEVTLGQHRSQRFLFSRQSLRAHVDELFSKETTLLVELPPLRRRRHWQTDVFRVAFPLGVLLSLQVTTSGVNRQVERRIVAMCPVVDGAARSSPFVSFQCSLDAGRRHTKPWACRRRQVARTVVDVRVPSQTTPPVADGAAGAWQRGCYAGDDDSRVVRKCMPPARYTERQRTASHLKE
jgi:hypothetical protein